MAGVAHGFPRGAMPRRSPDGGAAHEFSGQPTFAQFLADGRQVAFAWAGPPGTFSISTSRAGRESPRRLTNDPAPDDFPEWSPDGSRIAFIRAGMVYLAPVKGGPESRLTEAAGQASPGVGMVRSWRSLAGLRRAHYRHSAGLGNNRSEAQVPHRAPSRGRVSAFSWSGKD